MKTQILVALTMISGFSPGFAYGRTAAGLQKDTEQHIEDVESCLPPPVIVKGEPKSCTSLSKRMAELHVVGASVAVVHNGATEWARGYGIRQTGGDPVNIDTLFQAGSISKPVAAMGVLHLVQEQKLSLDTDINANLTTWKLRMIAPVGDHSGRGRLQGFARMAVGSIAMRKRRA